MRAMILVLCLTLLSACSTRPQITQQSLLRKCPTALERIDDHTGMSEAIAMNAWALAYHDCAIRHNALIDALTLEQE